MTTPDIGMSRELTVEARDTLERLSPDALEKLQGDGADNDEFGRYTFSVALSWINAGGTEDTYIETVLASHLGQTYPRQFRIERDLVRTFGSAEAKHDPTYAIGGVKERLQALREQVEIADLPPGLRATALAVVDKGLRVNAWTVDMSVRDLSEQAGVSLQTAQRHIRDKFLEVGLASKIESQGAGKARRIYLNLDYGSLAMRNTKVTRDHTYKYLPYICMITSQLLWTAHGVGQTAYRVYSSLGAVSSSVADLIRATNLARDTVTKHLGVLVDLGLAIEVEGKRKRYCLNLLPDFDHALAITGAVEKQQAKKDQYAHDRELRQSWIEDHEEDRGRSFDPIERTRHTIENALQDNPWNQDLISMDRRLWRLNSQGLEHLRGLRYDDQLTFHVTNPPLEYREYKTPYQPPVDNSGVDPFATPEAETIQVQDVYQGLPEIPF